MYPPGKPVPADSRAADDTMNGFLNKAWLAPRVLSAVDALKPLAKQAGLSLTQFALAWVLREPKVASAIIGASRPDQIDDNVGASGASVPAELFDAAGRLIAAAGAATA